MEAFGEAVFQRLLHVARRDEMPHPLRPFNGWSEVRSGPGAARYVLKVANETTRMDWKVGHEGRTPFQLIADFGRTGDDADLGLWHEYEQTTRGQFAVRWSPGLKALLGVGERSDEDLAKADEVEGRPFERFAIDADVWRSIVRTVPERQAILFEAMRDGGADAAALQLAVWSYHGPPGRT